MADRNLGQADQFQQASQAIVGLLSEIANADTRTHYVRQCAELFSNGDSRLMPLLAENLMVQVRRQRRSPGGGNPASPAVVYPNQHPRRGRSGAAAGVYPQSRASQ